MSAATDYAMLGRKDIERPPQYAIEGTSFDDYAADIADPRFIAPMSESKWEESLDNTFTRNAFGGHLDMQGVIKTREMNQVAVSGRLLPTENCLDLLEWCGNLDPGSKASGMIGTDENHIPITAKAFGRSSIRILLRVGGTADAVSVSGNDITVRLGATNSRTLAQIKSALESDSGAAALLDIAAIVGAGATAINGDHTITLSGGSRPGRDGTKQSRTWLSSYINSAGVEIFKIARGGKPISCVITLPKDGTATLAVTVKCRDYYETASPTTGTGMSGTPAYADAEPSAKALIYEDYGKFHFNPRLNAAKTAHTTDDLDHAGGSITITWTPRPYDSSGSLKDHYFDYAERQVAGQFSIFKKGADLNEAARRETQYVGWFDIQYIGSGDVGSESDTMAKHIPTTANAIEVYSKLPGAAGNDITFTILAASAVSDQIDIRTRAHDIQVEPKKGGSTLEELVAALNADALSSNLATFVVKGAGSTKKSAAVAKATLAGGESKWRRVIFERMKWETSSEPMLDDTAATMEDKSLTADAVTVAVT